MPQENTQAVKILTAALEAAKQGKITNLALLTFDADGVHHRSCVDSLPLEPAAIQRVVTEIEASARGLVREVRGMAGQRAA
jgi:hypothetical protein